MAGSCANAGTRSSCRGQWHPKPAPAGRDAALLARDKALDNRLLWLRDQIQELFAAPDAEETMEVEETIEDAIEDPEEVLDEA